MPTYEFRCPKGHEFEKFYRSISGAPTEVACPTCGKISERQLSGGAGLVFKGSGFYITDYGKDGKKPQTPAGVAGGGAGPSGGSETTSAKGESKSSEAKPSSAPKPSSEPKPSAESKPRDSTAGTASKSAAKKSSGKPRSTE
jgi:putative FmdB family regulatory protein